MSTPVAPTPRLLQMAVQYLLLLALLVPYGCSDPSFHPADRVDQDGDGFYAIEDPESTALSVQQLQNLKLDCDDDDDDIFPNAAELCDGKDNDCDGVEEADETDDDGDGFSECGYSELAANVGQKDCDDFDDEIYPDAVDLCDGKDNDCDGRDLEGGLWPGVEADRDGDLYVGCDDCSDDPLVDPQAAVTNAGIDPPECSDYLREIAAPGEAALGTDCQPYTGAQTLWWPDFDGDGDADIAATDSNGMVQETCGPVATDFSASEYIRVDPGGSGEPDFHADCDDTSALLNSYDLDGDTYSTCGGDLKFGGVQSADGNDQIHPDAPEICDREDNDVDGEVDEDFDSDDDGAPANTPACVEAYQGQPLDCNDTDPSLNQSDLDNDGFSTCGADSIEASGDEDCNDGNSLLNLTDIDGDGATTCDLPADCDDFNAVANQTNADGDDWTSCDGDCDDSNDEVFPGAPAECDSVDDNDCNGVDDPNEADLDNDGYSICDGDCNDQDPVLNAADLDTDGFSSCTGDCDDSSNQTYPGAPIVCNDGSDDNDCNGVVDLNEADQDNDGYSLCDGDCNDFDLNLDLDDADGDGFSSCTGDCDDTNSAVNSTVDDDGDGWDVCGDTLNPSDGVPADCDDSDATLNWNDVDGDGSSTCSSPADCDDFDPDLNQIDQDNDQVSTCNNDCDDNNATVRPTFTSEAPSRDGLDNDCDGTTDEHATWLGGYIVVVEMMISADASNSDGLGEYLELYNPYDVPVDLRGWEVVVQNSATGLPDTYTFPSGIGVDPIIVPANTAATNLRMVLARANNDLVYGFDVTDQSGVAGYIWEAALFGNTGGTVSFHFAAASGGPLIDQVSWGPSTAGGWLQGRAMSIPGSIGISTHNANNSASSVWCTEVPTIGGSNQGTPGDPAGCN